MAIGRGRDPICYFAFICFRISKKVSSWAARLHCSQLGGEELERKPHLPKLQKAVPSWTLSPTMEPSVLQDKGLSCEMRPNQKSQLSIPGSQKLPQNAQRSNYLASEVVDKDLSVGRRNKVKNKPLLSQNGQASCLWLNIKDAPIWQRGPPPPMFPALSSCGLRHHSLTRIIEGGSCLMRGDQPSQSAQD